MQGSTGEVRTRACFRINDLKSFALDRSATVPHPPQCRAIFQTKMKQRIAIIY